MSIGSTNQKVRLGGNGVTQVFAYNFRITAESQLNVRIADADDVQYPTSTPMILDTHYTVSGKGDAGGGNVTTLDLTSLIGFEILPTGWSITIKREVTLTQATDLINQGSYFPETIEDRFDYQTFISQQQQEQIDRSPKVSETGGTEGDELLDEIDASVAAAAASATAAETAETNAETAETNAETAQTAAELAQTDAETAQAAAELAQTGAETAETNAETAETNAETAETNAGTSETNAAASALAASDSETAAGLSETAAETAETNAETAETNAETAQTAAELAQTNAETAETNAETAETNAETAETNADASAVAAAASAAEINTPGLAVGDTDKMLVVNSTYDGYDIKVVTSPFKMENVGLLVGLSVSRLRLRFFTSAGVVPQSATNYSTVSFRHSFETSASRGEVRVTAPVEFLVTNGATLGHQDGVAQYVYVYLFDIGSNVAKLAVSSSFHDEGCLHSASIVDASSDDPNAIYSDVVITNRPMRFFGKILSTQSTAGVWDTLPAESSIVPMDTRVIPLPVVADAAKLPVVKPDGTGYELVLSSTFSSNVTVVTKSDDYTILDDDTFRTIIVDVAAKTITLPTVADNVNRIITVKNTSAGLTTVDAEDAEQIDGEPDASLGELNSFITVQSNGTTWNIIAQFNPIIDVYDSDAATGYQTTDILIMEDEVETTHGAYNPSTGVYTFQRTGVVKIFSNFTFENIGDLGYAYLIAEKNTTIDERTSYVTPIAALGTVNPFGSWGVYGNRGDTIRIRIIHNESASGTINTTTAINNWVAFVMD